MCGLSDWASFSSARVPEAGDEHQGTETFERVREWTELSAHPDWPRVILGVLCVPGFSFLDFENYWIFAFAFVQEIPSTHMDAQGSVH